jgi:hypothetical protein
MTGGGRINVLGACRPGLHALISFQHITTQHKVTKRNANTFYDRSARDAGMGRNFQVIYEQAKSHGQKVQSAGSNRASTDSAFGSSWA